MVARWITVILVSSALSVRAQESDPSNTAGLVRISAAVSPGFQLNAPSTNIYLNGRLEYFPESRISFLGEVYWYRGNQQRTALMARNDQVVVGPFYHWVHGRLDLSLGMEAGISFARPERSEIPPPAGIDPLRVIPNVALCSGLTYTIWDHFHFFLDARLAHAEYTGAENGTIPLDEVTVGGGLGWHFRP
ncbi:MAG: hypothetical protein IPO60_01795 [Flavobacteriales bacterium]|jgi:hypothetical protein|nr:hypothetical protein [Flavobacteriales bacterium]MBK6891790.1 hypothetical protein [Flavobacteriales bacterium]MBK7247708.1 hypothetical protein [Flavobacteriales bacterium]MBK7288284.1 hypothetical protein [Flavobacteriales bacterium]MBK9597073.1 hypothetical protein [Flavobacteriales bacterium]